VSRHRPKKTWSDAEQRRLEEILDPCICLGSHKDRGFSDYNCHFCACAEGVLELIRQNDVYFEHIMDIERVVDAAKILKSKPLSW
jgi:hypothetical protein